MKSMGLNQKSIRLLAALSVVVVVSLATAPITMASAPAPNQLPLAGPADPNAINPSSVTLPSGQVMVKPSGPGTVMGANAEAISAQPDLQTRFGNSQFAAPQAAAAAGSKPSGAESMPGGVDVSGWQANVDWQTVWNQGARFAYIKASEGPWTMNDYFAQQYNGAANIGMIRGAYHFAQPNQSSGANQAQVFVQSGGGWSADGITLPGVLDLEFNNGKDGTNRCFSQTSAQLTAWSSDFFSTYKAKTGRDAVLYTSYSFWQECMASATAFSQTNPLWIAAYGPSLPNLLIPGGWPQFTFWQFSDNGPYNGGDSNVFNGDISGLQRLAKGNDSGATKAITETSAKYHTQLNEITSAVICGIKDGGCFQNYQGGSIMWSPNTGAQPMFWGAIRTLWQQGGFENGALGYPTSPQSCGLKDAGCFQNFQGGTVMWSPATGAQSLSFQPIRDVWAIKGYESGKLGYPTSNTTCELAGGGCFQNFQAGTIMWSPRSGAFALQEPILKAWARSGYEGGKLGYPVSDMVCGLAKDGCFQNFQTGTIMWSPASGAQALSQTAIREAWGRTGFEGGTLGYPVSDPQCGLKNGGCFQNFEKGTMMWSSASGANAILPGPIQKAWAGQGFENGSLGYPTNNQSCTSGNCSQDFLGGKISSNSGAPGVITRK